MIVQVDFDGRSKTYIACLAHLSIGNSISTEACTHALYTPVAHMLH